jgi:diacylglycerol kinase (ATP)
LKAALIFNPASGRSRGASIASQVQTGLRALGMEAELYATKGPQQATAIAEGVAPQVDVVVAIGGDGTVNEVVNGLAAARDRSALSGAEASGRPRLAIIPAGTVNVLALDLRLPFRIDRACEVIAAGKTLSIDLGKANGRRFLLMMGAGIDALTVRNLDPQAKRWFKELAFVGTGLKAGLAEQPPLFRVLVDGVEYHATFFVAGNSRYYGGRFGVTPAAHITDGLLDLLLFTGTTRAALAAFWLGVPSGLHLRNRHVVYLLSTAAEVTPLDPEVPVWFQTDGELAGCLPARVEIEPHALEVLVP